MSIAGMLILLAVGSMRASRNLHSNLLNRVLHATPAFFDTTPGGRIINWFSKDMNDIDTKLATNLNIIVYLTKDLLALLFLIIWTIPGLILLCAPLTFMFVFLRVKFNILLLVIKVWIHLMISHVIPCFFSSIVTYVKTRIQ